MTLDVWPPLPLVIFVHGYKTDSGFPAESVDNIIAALERRDRVSQITLMDVPSSDLEILLAAIQEPFPELTYLELGYDLWSDETGPVISELFLGSSAPRLQSIWLSCIPFPGLPKLLLSATRLIDLQLWNIPHSGYISPEAMATTLSTLTSLQFLSLEFRSPQSRPDQDSRRLPPLTRSVLPVLIVFIFRGVSEYLEYLVALIDFPQLSSLYVTFFNQILFDTPQFIQLFNRTPTLKVLEKAHVIFRHDIVRVRFSSSLTPLDGGLDVTILCRELDWQISSLEQVCTASFGGICRVAGLCASTPRCNTSPRGSVWNRPQSQFLDPVTGPRAHYCTLGQSPLLSPFLCLTLLPCPIPLFLLYT
jgi:hypothetical protein